MIKVPCLNPLLVVLALRAWQVASQSQPAPLLWMNLRQHVPDPDRNPADWERVWPPQLCMALARAFSSRAVKDWLSGRHPDASPPLAAQSTAAAIEQGLDSVRFGLPASAAAIDPDSTPAAAIMGFTLDAPETSAAVLAAAHHARRAGAQVWLDVPFARENTSLQRYRDALRSGLAWWLRPPSQAQEWSSYRQLLSHTSRCVLEEPSWDQWIWPWADLFQQAVVEILLASPSPRTSTPCGRGPRRGEEWARARKDVWETARRHMGEPGTLEDVLAGILARAAPGLSPRMEVATTAVKG